MPKRKLRGRAKGPTLQKKAKQGADVKKAVLDNPSNGLGFDPEFVEEQDTATHGFTKSYSPVPVDPVHAEEQEQETGTIAKITGRGRPNGSSLQKKVKSNANVKTTVLDNASNELEVDPEFVEEQETGILAKKKGRGRPKGSSLQKKAKPNANGETTVLDNVLNELEVDPEFVEKQETGTHGFTFSYSPAPVDPGFLEEQETGILAKKKGRGRPKGSSLQKKVKPNANVKTTVLDNVLNELEVDPEFVEKQETGTHGFTFSYSPAPVDPGFLEEQETGAITKRKGRGRPKGSSLQTKIKQSANVESTILDNPSNELEVYPEFVEEQGTGTMAKGRGRPKGSSLQQKVKQSANVKTVVLNNPSNELEVDQELAGEQETEMPKNRGRGRPKRSSDQSNQKSIHRNVSSPINPSNMVETVHGCKESENPDLQLYVFDNSSNESEVALGLLEEWERDLLKKRGRPKRSRDQNCRESVPRNMISHINPSNMVRVDHDCEESGNEDMPNEKGQEQPRESRLQNCHRNPDGTVVYDNPSNVMEVSPVCEDSPKSVFNTPMQRGRGRPKGSMNQKNHPQNADTRIGPKKIVRGRKRGVMLEMKRKLSPDGKLDVIIHPERRVAIGPGRNDFITDLSIILRKNVRFNVNKWRRVPQSTRDTIVEKVLNHWRLPDTDMVRKAIIDEAGRLYRNWRNRLHEYYLMFETKEEALKHVPEDVNGPDWKFLVDYFSSPSFEMISMKNKACRAKQRTLHTSGRKSFQAISFDARDPATGDEPDLQTLWQITHKRANGEWIDEASKEINDKVTEQVGEMLEEKSQEGVEIVEPEVIKTAFKTLVGKKSYMQGFEEGLRSSSSENSVRVKRLQAELDAQRMETANAKKECNEIRAKLVEVESQLAEERRKREESEVRLVDRQKDMQEINIQVQTAIQSALSQYCPSKTEAVTSSEHIEKVAELEAQLHEAEDVITDIRAELARYRLY